MVENKLTAQTKSPVIFDATGLIVGRVSSVISKRLLQGEQIIIVNSESAVISGRRVSRVAEARLFLEAGHLGHGPYHPRRPDQIFRRVIRGMLPWRKPKGKQAYKRLRVFIGIPEELKGKAFETIPQANASKLRCPYFTMGEFAKEIGWKPVGE